MTDTEIEQYFFYHNSNMKVLKLGYDEIRNKIKQLYIEKNKDGILIFSLPDTNAEKIQSRKKEMIFSRILSGLQVSWAEESIKRLLYESKVFSDQQRNYILELSALEQRWYKSLHLTFCIAYDLVPTTDPFCQAVNLDGQRWNLGDELVDQYLELKNIITNYLSPNFSIRNKVQHGEWIYAFRNNSKEYSNDLTLKVKHENIVTATSRFTLVNTFYQMLVDLGRFKSNSFKKDTIQTPFEYFYADKMKKIRFEMNKITNPELEKFIAEIVNKSSRASAYHTT